jgi:predicted RNA-binding Zn-ribbon protein involved in translation (DUF1610 family)
MSNLPLGAEFDSRAPYNQKDLPVCEECGTTMIVRDAGEYKGKVWQEYICYGCGFWFTEEPDYD